MNHKLSLKRHCIETEIKKQYNKYISDYFKAGKNPSGNIEKSIEDFRQALETLDFGFLRSRYRELRGNSDAAVVFYRNEAGKLHITINGEEIEP